MIHDKRLRVLLGIATPEETNEVNQEGALTRARGQWAPYVEWDPEDPDGLVCHAYAMHASGKKDREGRYIDRRTADLAANDYAMKLCREGASVESIIKGGAA